MAIPLVNLSFYRFVPLSDLPSLREHLRMRGHELQLRGTVLLAAEGVNAMVTGTKEAIKIFETESLKLFGPFTSKLAEVNEHSFERFLVKLKNEIISVGDPQIRPFEKTAPRLSPQELKQWIDEGRKFHLIDTRNSYEVEVGTFKGAQHFALEASSEFSAKAAANTEALKDLPVVTFCTGGIRCEKASAVLLNLGLNNVYQLDGGILRYFEENGSAHYEGNCFVYDWRLAVDGNLKPVARSEDPEKDFGRHKRRER